MTQFIAFICNKQKQSLKTQMFFKKSVFKDFAIFTGNMCLGKTFE